MLKQLKYFQSVVRLGSFSAVAEGRLAREINGVPIRTLEYGGNWWLCICGGEPGEPEIIELKE